ncbi:MAG TPA: PIN domain-containing protein, partial [Castellaniella sp.]|nr:PIN domain-containing protein [Castellaniella sp.]
MTEAPPPAVQAKPQPDQAKPQPVQAKPQPVQAKPQPVQAKPQPAQARQPVPSPSPTAPKTGAPAGPARPAAASSKLKRLPTAQRKLFVLDTNVLLHDPSSLFRFAEHDVFLPMIVLEELDHQKKGMSEVARNARQVSRYLDELVDTSDLTKGVPLDALGHTDALGSLYFQTKPTNTHLPLELPMGKADNVILGIVHGLREYDPKREIVLVSKDINMR